MMVAVAGVLSYYLLTYLRLAFLPGRKQLNEKRKRYDIKGGNASLGDLVAHLTQVIIPKALYTRIETFIYQTGQFNEWTVPKVIRAIIVSFLFSLTGVVLILILYASVKSWFLLIFAFLIAVIVPFYPLIIFRLERSEYIKRILFQTPEMLDIFESELVHGSGSIEMALKACVTELDGDLKRIMMDAYREIQKSNRGLHHGLKIIKDRVSHKIYDQFILMIEQYMLVGRASKMIDNLQSSLRIEINKIIKEETTKKNIMVLLVAIGIIVNLAILTCVPIFVQIVSGNNYFY